MRIFFLCIGGLITSTAVLFLGYGIFRGIECSQKIAQMSNPDFIMCSRFDPLVFVGLIFLFVGAWMVYENIRRDGDIHPKRRRLMRIVVFILIGAPTCFILFFFILALIRLDSTDRGVGVYSNVPEDSESAPFGVYDDTDTVRIYDSTDIHIVDHAIVASGKGISVKGVLQNNTSVSIAYVHLRFSCENGQDSSFVVGSRKKKIRSLNRMTDQYEDREYDVPEAIAPGEKYHFEYEIDDATVTSACSLSVDGWTDYRTINQ